MRYPKATKQELTAPTGKFRVLGIADSSGRVYLIGDFDSRSSAEEVAKQKASAGNPIFLYNDQGELIVRYGSWH